MGITNFYGNGEMDAKEWWIKFKNIYFSYFMTRNRFSHYLGGPAWIWFSELKNDRKDWSWEEMEQLFMDRWDHKEEEESKEDDGEEYIEESREKEDQEEGEEYSREDDGVAYIEESNAKEVE